MIVNEIGTMHPAHEGCCGCITVREHDTEKVVEFYCNECGLVTGSAAIPEVIEQESERNGKQ
jgi:hypothetical protein